MTREMKFRCWDMTRKEMVEPASIEFFDTGKIEVFPCYEKSEYIPLQFTGLKDKNGKEIYEGDILTKSYGQAEPLMVGKKTPMYEVSFRKGHFICVSVEPIGSPDYLSNLNDDFEIIGNIWENPELLK